MIGYTNQEMIEYFEKNIRHVLSNHDRQDPNWREHLKWVFTLRREYKDLIRMGLVHNA